MTRDKPRVIGWKLDRAQRDDLIHRFPGRYPDTIADHVTFRSNAVDEPLPPTVTAAIVGHADDGDSLEAMVVAIDGVTDRPDGSTYHITWSLDRSKGRAPKESNELLRSGWTCFEQAIPLLVRPARF